MSSDTGPESGRDYLSVMYDSAVRPATSYPKKLCVLLATKFNLLPGMKILDVGCGRGEFLQGFGDLGLVSTGVDSSSQAGSLAPKAEVRTVNLDNELLPFFSNTFDVIFSKSVLEHLERPSKLLEEQFRVLKPGGLIINMTPAWEYQYRIFFDDFTHKSPLTRKSLLMATTAAGFEVVRSDYFRQLPPLWSIPALKVLAELTRFLVPTRWGSRIKWIRFSKELMVLCSARKPGA